MVNLEEIYKLMVNPPPEKDWKRFLQYIRPRKREHCWNWQAYRCKNGYGSFWLNGRMWSTSFLMGKWMYGEPHNMVFDHFVCDNPPCVNPFHLVMTTKTINTLRGKGPTAKNARKTHCKKGHELVKDIYHTDRPNARFCKICSFEYTTNKNRQYRLQKQPWTVQTDEKRAHDRERYRKKKEKLLVLIT